MTGAVVNVFTTKAFLLSLLHETSAACLFSETSVIFVLPQ